jgi:hypothetical protein
MSEKKRPTLADVFPVLKPKPEGTCKWFLGCARPATGTMNHPVLGDVPICDECRRKAQ